jgi:heme/copper-type cytochrome/quinol oxidase subunit 2
MFETLGFLHNVWVNFSDRVVLFAQEFVFDHQGWGAFFLCFGMIAFVWIVLCALLLFAIWYVTRNRVPVTGN